MRNVFRHLAAARKARGTFRPLRSRNKTETPLETPVVFVVFNRPRTTEPVFAEIARARPRRLLIVADGPRPDRPDDVERCATVRAITEQVSWDCEVSRHYADVNLGLARRWVTGLDWAFDQVSEAIILEDDCLPHPSFFPFCRELLAKYRADARVMAICGDNYLFGRTHVPYSYFFHRVPGWYGWATWRRAWQHYDFEMSRWPDLRGTPFLEQALPNDQAVEYWRAMFDLTHSGALRTWDSQWILAVFEHQGLAATAGVNLVTNIGGGPDAVHMTNPDHPALNIPRQEINFPLRHPPAVTPDSSADELTFENIYLGELAGLRAVESRLDEPPSAG